MKKLFIEVKAEDTEIRIPESIRNKKVGILATVQHLHQIKDIQKHFYKAIIGGQVTGCNASNALKIKNRVDCFFLLADGNFHALEIARKTKKPVYTAAGVAVTEKEIEDYEKQLKGKLMRFFMAKNIGILVSIKPGQYNLKLAEKLKKRYKNKDSVIFMADTIDVHSLENFTGIDMFINTACSRIENSNIINAEDIPK